MSAPSLPAVDFGPATLDDLYQVEGKAELVAGRIIPQVPSGFDPSRVALLTAFELEIYSRGRGEGFAFGDGMGYALERAIASGRQSFSPDASFYFGAKPANRMRFIKGVPAFAVEVRSENDYGPAAEAALQAKRADYFEAGTAVVWDVDPEARVILSFRGDPAIPVATFHPGDAADAEPAVPGWRVAVVDLFQ